MEYIALVEQNRNKAKATEPEKAEKPQKRLTAKLIAKQDKPENWAQPEACKKEETMMEEAE